MANTDVVLQGVKDYTLELLGTKARDEAVDAADRAEAQAERAEAAADNAEVGIRDDTIAKQHLTPGLRGEVDGKADKADVPVTDAGYLTHLAGDEPDKYPYGVSVAMNRGNDGWTYSIRADVPDYEASNFVIVLTLQQSLYSRSTTQYVSSYEDDPRPIYTRKWTSDGWGPWRSLTDDGHTHTVSEVEGLGSALAGKADTGHGHTAQDVGARPDTWTPTAQDVGARPDDWVPTAAQVGARPDTWTPTAAQVGAATPGYVDSRIQEVTADQWPSSPQPGVIYWQAED